MSVIKLVKDHKGKKAGAVLDAVPFLEAKKLCEDGVAVRANPPAAAAGKPAGPDYPALLAAERSKAAGLEAEIADLKRQVAELAKK